MPIEEPQDRAGKEVPNEEPAARKKGLIRILRFKKNKKKEKEKMENVLSAMTVIDEVASPSIEAAEPIARVEPTPSSELITNVEPTPKVQLIIKEEPTPDVEGTTKGDGKVCRSELVLAFHTS
jgi:hypothetical protein